MVDKRGELRQNKSLTIEDKAVEIINVWNDGGKYIFLNIESSFCCGVSFSLDLVDDLPEKVFSITDRQSGIRVYYNEEQANYFINLEIITSSVQKDTLVVRRKKA